jgi:hypothetical protein
VCDSFLTYWEQHGGAQKIGRPLSNPFLEATTSEGKVLTNVVQYFDYAVLTSTDANPTTGDIVQIASTAASFRRKYPNGEPVPYIENPPRPPDARNVVTTYGGDYSATLPVVMSYTTSVEFKETQDFYADVMKKNRWEWVCVANCINPQNVNLPGLGFWWTHKGYPIEQEAGYSMQLEIREINTTESMVIVTIDDSAPPEIPPPTSGSSNPAEKSGVQVGMPHTGLVIVGWLFIGLVSLALIVSGLVARHYFSLK